MSRRLLHRVEGFGNDGRPSSQGACVGMGVSIENAEHYIWGESCDGWHLLKREEMSVIQEHVPAGGVEVMHYHTKARQFFYILGGEGTMVFEDHQVILRKGEGIEIAPQVKHQFMNRSTADVNFLVVSVPSTRGDRVNLKPDSSLRSHRPDAYSGE